MVKVFKKRVLLVDNDIQANVSKFFSVHSYEYKSMENVLRDKETIAEDVIRSSGRYGLDIIPANMNLDAAAVDLMLDQEANQVVKLREVLQQVEDQEKVYDENGEYVLQDVVKTIEVPYEVEETITIDHIPAFIREQYIETERKIIKLTDGSFAFEDEVNLEEEAKRKAEKELAEAKKQAENYQFEKYKKEKYGIAWVERADGTRIGFDTDIDQGSQTDWHSVRRIIDDGVALGMFGEGVEPTAPYKYWINEHEKEYGIVTLTELIKAGLISSQTQNKAYVAFEAIKKEIEACTTVEEVQKYLVD